MECIDPKCPFHGSVKLHGRSFVGTVISTKMQKTVTVEWSRIKYIQKYERNEKRRSKVHAHQPACMELKEGDQVRVTETKPLSKTVTFVVVEKLSGNSKGSKDVKSKEPKKQKEEKKEDKKKE